MINWYDNIDKTKLKDWLRHRENQVPSGFGDPFQTSLRSVKRFYSALSGDAKSRPSQQVTDLTAAKLFVRESNCMTHLGYAFYHKTIEFGLNDLDSEKAYALVLLLEAIKRHNDYYTKMIHFWVSLVNKVGFDTLKNNIHSSYLLSRFNDYTNSYAPIDEIWENLDNTTFKNLNIDELQSFINDPTIKTIQTDGKLRNNLSSWGSRDSRKDLFEAIEILYSNDKNDTINKICDDNEKIKIKQIIKFYQKMNPLNSILYGPPGTGKTFNTVRHAMSCVKGVNVSEIQDREKYKKEFDNLLSSKQIRFVTFHQSYSYEDFVEGIKAEIDNGQINYVPKDGIFKDICKDAENDKGNNYVLIIDEINRGNISNIFGELITLIEPSKRTGEDDELTVTLPYSGESFSVPSNLYIIGTMNSADKSIALMDTALRRRFEFIEYLPKPELLKGIIINDAQEINVKKMLETINRRIEVLLDKDHTIGHAYLINVTDKASLRDALVNKIIPLVEEYFYNEFEKIRLVFGDDDANDKEEDYQIFVEDKTGNYDHKNLFGRDIDGYDEKKFYQLNQKLFELEPENIPVEIFTKIYEK